MYELCFAFRNNCEINADNKETMMEINELLEKQKQLFQQEDYYFCNIVYNVVAYKK